MLRFFPFQFAGFEFRAEQRLACRPVKVVTDLDRPTDRRW
jgi:hypothetical protein